MTLVNSHTSIAAGDTQSETAKESSDAIRKEKQRFVETLGLQYRKELDALLYGRSFLSYYFVEEGNLSHFGVVDKPPYSARTDIRYTHYYTHWDGPFDQFIYFSHFGVRVSDMGSEFHSRGEIKEHFEAQVEKIRVNLKENLNMLVGGLGLISPFDAGKAITAVPFGESVRVGYGYSFEPFSAVMGAVPICVNTEGISIGLRQDAIDFRGIQSLHDNGFLRSEEARFSQILLIMGVSPTDYAKATPSCGVYADKSRMPGISLFIEYKSDVALPLGQIFAEFSFTEESEAESFERGLKEATSELGDIYAPLDIVTADEFIRVRSEIDNCLTLEQRYFVGAESRVPRLSNDFSCEVVLPSAPAIIRNSDNTFIYNIADPRVDTTLQKMVINTAKRKLTQYRDRTIKLF